MVHLNQNKQKNQVTLNLQDNEVSGSGTVYLFEFRERHSNAFKYVIPLVVSDTTRTTVVHIDTRVSDPANGKVLLDYGQHELHVYRQTSATNLDPTDASVDGKIFETKALIEFEENTEDFIVYEPEVASTISYKF